MKQFKMTDVRSFLNNKDTHNIGTLDFDIMRYPAKAFELTYGHRNAMGYVGYNAGFVQYLIGRNRSISAIKLQGGY